MNSVHKCTLFLVFTFFSLRASGSSHLRAVFDMSDIKGEIRFTRDSDEHTNISLNLTGLTSPFTWKIHKFPIVYRGNSLHTCQTLYTGGLFDPSGKLSGTNYVTRCNKTMHHSCAIGDLSGKHGNLESSTNILQDSNLPLSGRDSIFGRTVVLYNQSSTPWACALIDYDDVITGLATFRGGNSGITGKVRLRQARGDITKDTSVEVDLFYSNDVTVGSHNFALEIVDKRLPEEGIPSYEGSHCKMTTGREISRYVNVPLARHGPSSKRMLFGMNNLPLAGSNSVINKTLVLKLNGNPIICASVYEVLPIEAEALFDIDSVKGKFHFKQDSELAPTVFTADVRGLASKANTYHVHVYRVLDSAMKNRLNSFNMCANSQVAGHWRPYNTDSAAPGTRTVDKYELGDLSGKYGVIGKSDTLSLMRKDYNLPLFGGNSILFRSMVIHLNINSTRWVCSNINPVNPTFHFKVRTHFIGPAFNGSITVEQASFIRPYAATHITTFFLDLRPMNVSSGMTRSHNWHVHEREVSADEMSPMGKRCISTAGHFNPYKVSLKSNYSSTCGPMNLLRCELGDISSKIGKYNIGGGKNRFTESENYFAGLNTIVGRSIVVHTKDSGAPRLGCASMEMRSSNFVTKELIIKKTAVGDVRELLAKALEVNLWRVVHDGKFIDYDKMCKKTTFILIDSTSSNLGQKFENLQKNWPEMLDEFRPASMEECSMNMDEAPSGVSVQATSFILVVAAVLVQLLS